MDNILGSNTAQAVKAASGNLTYQDGLNQKKVFDNYASSLAPNADVSGGDYSGGGGGSQGATSYTDPYASIYSLYDQMYNAQQDALNRQRQARLDALQANYNNARSKLDSSYASGETELNQDADEALRQAYISNMLNQKALNQQLAGQGITGGALESILARAYNTYGNNRNNIEQSRMDNLRSLLANYQGTLGDIEESYLSGMANADSDYSGAIANAMTNYYGNLADLQKQNIANQYKASLNKTGGSQSSKEQTLNTTIVNGLKNHKGNLAAKRD